MPAPAVVVLPAITAMGTTGELAAASGLPSGEEVATVSAGIVGINVAVG